MNVNRNGTVVKDGESSKDDVLETIKEVMSDVTPDRNVEISRAWSDAPFVSNGLYEVHVQIGSDGNVRIDWSDVSGDLTKALIDRFENFPDSSGPERVNPEVDDEKTHAEVDETKFTKDEAGYVEPYENHTTNKCENCAHYDESGGCKVVEGGVDEEAVCRDLYADFGMFVGLDERGNPEVTLSMWGEEADIRAVESTLPRTLNEIEDELQQRLNK